MQAILYFEVATPQDSLALVNFGVTPSVAFCTFTQSCSGLIQPKDFKSHTVCSIKDSANRHTNKHNKPDTYVGALEQKYSEEMSFQIESKHPLSDWGENLNSTSEPAFST